MVKVITDKKLLMRVSDDVTEKDAEEVKEVIKQLTEYLNNTENEYAISAPQIGVFKKIFCIKDEYGNVTAFINPGVKLNKDLNVDSEEYKVVCETNASYPNKKFLNFRANKIIVNCLDSDLRLIEGEFRDAYAYLYLQMMDMVSGYLPTVFGLELPENYDSMTKEEQAECVDIYYDYILKFKEKIDKDIESDEELKLRSEGLRFTSALLKGEVELDTEDEDKILEKYKSKKYSKLRKGKTR